MDILNRQINIFDCKCHTVNPNLTLLKDVENNIWGQNICVKNEIEDNWVCDGYNKFISDTRLPPLSFPNNIYNGIIASYSDIKRIYKSLKKYQDISHFLCENCNNNVSEHIDEYIDLAEEYFMSDGNILYPFTYFLINEDFIDDTTTTQLKPLKYYKTYSTVSFIQYVAQFYGITPNLLISTEQGNADIWYSEYIPSTGKVTHIINMIVTYYNNILMSFTSNTQTLTINGDNNLYYSPSFTYRDIYNELTNSIATKVRELAIEYYNINSKCHTELYNMPSYSYFESLAIKGSYVRFQVNINSSSEDMGVFFVPVSTWEPGKTYKSGDRVFYDGYTYVLMGGEYSGAYNEIENVIYFDEYKTKTIAGENGYFDGYQQESNGNYSHWYRTTIQDSNGYVDIQAIIDSQLSSLKSLINGNDEWFNPEGKFKTGVNFNEKYDPITGGIYRSYIKSITPLPSPEVGLEIVKYNYIINELSTYPYPMTGINYTEEYQRYHVASGSGEESYVILHQGVDGVVGTTVDWQVDKTRECPISGSTGSVMTRSSVLDYFPLTRAEYLLGIVERPFVNADINIERGKNYAYDKHMAFSETRTLNQILNYHNGGFFTIKKIDGSSQV